MRPDAAAFVITCVLLTISYDTVSHRQRFELYAANISVLFFCHGNEKTD